MLILLDGFQCDQLFHEYDLWYSSVAPIKQSILEVYPNKHIQQPREVVLIDDLTYVCSVDFEILK